MCDCTDQDFFLIVGVVLLHLCYKSGGHTNFLVNIKFSHLNLWCKLLGFLLQVVRGTIFHSVTLKDNVNSSEARLDTQTNVAVIERRSSYYLTSFHICTVFMMRLRSISTCKDYLLKAELMIVDHILFIIEHFSIP